MKTSMKLIFFVCALVLSGQAQAQIANSYPNDLGIENDSRVVFVEQFTGDLESVLSRYQEIVNAEGMSLQSDIPAGSAQFQSLRISSEQGVNTGGHLFKSFNPGFEGSIYLRYYVKYPDIPMGYQGHQGLWFGGYNPIINFPYPRAGYCGLGDSRLSIAFENVWQEEVPPGMDAYIYWGDMRSFDGGYTCFGNTFITEGRNDYGQPPSGDRPLCDLDEWMCIEIMVKLNEPVEAYNGEMKIWKDGVLLGHWGPGFPNGHWLKDKWYNNPLDPPFEGFRWRTDENLNINWIWIEFWHTSGGPSSHIHFSNIVMATDYIGPVYDPTTGVAKKSENALRVYPNPVNSFLHIENIPKEGGHIILRNTWGQTVLEAPLSDRLDVSLLKPGIYFLHIVQTDEQQIHKIVKI